MHVDIQMRIAKTRENTLKGFQGMYFELSTQGQRRFGGDSLCCCAASKAIFSSRAAFIPVCEVREASLCIYADVSHHVEFHQGRRDNHHNLRAGGRNIVQKFLPKSVDLKLE